MYKKTYRNYRKKNKRNIKTKKHIKNNTHKSVKNIHNKRNKNCRCKKCRSKKYRNKTYKKRVIRGGNSQGGLPYPYNSENGSLGLPVSTRVDNDFKLPGSPITVGGKKIGGKNMKGGSIIDKIIPSELLNGTRHLASKIGHISDNFKGVESSPSSMVYPTQQPYAENIVNNTKIDLPPNIKDLYLKAHNSVDGI